MFSVRKAGLLSRGAPRCWWRCTAPGAAGGEEALRVDEGGVIAIAIAIAIAIVIVHPMSIEPLGHRNLKTLLKKT
jgi:hypothetical protein